MATCLKFSNDSTVESGQTYKVYFGDFYAVETCTSANDEFIVLTPQEFAVLTTKAEILDSPVITGLIDPVEVSATFGTAFALIFFLSAIAYKIKVGKRVIKMA
jgi:hypothetical protein